MSFDLPALLDRVHHRYPSLLIDAVGEHEPGTRLTAFKNLTINEDFFPGHFPGTPVMPAVLTIEALTQVAALLILAQADVAPTTHVSLRGVNNAKFRRQVQPGDRLMLEVSLVRRRTNLAKAQAVAYVAGQRVAEAACPDRDAARRRAALRGVAQQRRPVRAQRYRSGESLPS